MKTNMPTKPGGGNHPQKYNEDTGEYVEEKTGNSHRPIHALPSILIKLNGSALSVLTDVLKSNSICSPLEFTDHSNSRFSERGIRYEDLIDAILCPIHVFPEKIDINGRPSIKILGRNVTFYYNSLDKRIITMHKTKTKYYKKYESEDIY